MSLQRQRKMLANAGFTGFHLGYGNNSSIEYDPILVYKKNPYIPILEMPYAAFSTLDDKQLLEIIKAEVASSYEYALDQAEVDLEDLMVNTAIARENANKLTDRGLRYQTKMAISQLITKARLKIKKLQKRVDFYKNFATLTP